jgi:ubiquinone/menaquinone biosynthesis C-methylase UbiE
MYIGEKVLYSIAKRWPIPHQIKDLAQSGDYKSQNYHIDYAFQRQYLNKVKSGVQFDFYRKNILEIGTGHGGIATFLGVIGANHVVGIDLNTEHLNYAKIFLELHNNRLGNGVKLPVEFLEMNAYDLKLEPSSFDIVLADNVFEHFMEPKRVMEESHRVLKKGGILVVPIFSSIYSKYALHLKTGLKVPWTNLFFSERTIVRVLYRLAEENNELFIAYPGLKDKPEKVRNVRAYKDLNDITYNKFKEMAKESGFRIKYFHTVYPNTLKFHAALIRKIPGLKNSVLADIFSTGASSILEKI